MRVYNDNNSLVFVSLLFNNSDRKSLNVSPLRAAESTCYANLQVM